MSDKTIAQKLQLKPGRSLLLVNAPKGYTSRLGDLPAGVTVLKAHAGPVDVIQVFAADREELEAQLPALKALLAPNGALWVTYHKGASKIKTDINRDSINAYARSIGLEGIAMISVDEDWSALRLKVVGE